MPVVETLQLRSVSMSSFRETLKFKLSVPLLAVICLGFSTLIFMSNRSLDAHATAGVKDIQGQISALESADLTPAMQSELGQVKSALDRLPAALVQETRTTALVTAVICLTLVMAGAGLLLDFLFFKPVNALSLGLEKAIQGDERDLTVRLPMDRKDEIGQLCQKFNTFVATLDQIIQDIGAKTETIAAASSEVSGVSDLMNEESVDLNTRSNSVAAAAEEMNVSMQTMAAASDQAAANIAMVSDAAGQMQGRMAGVAGNCDHAGQISNSARAEAQRAAEKVGRLGEAANEITQVTQMITEIAEQTNLLALNATIEAARAGAAGKGFAVVADEIKNLAAQTAEATQNIQEKIRDIQESTHEAVSEVTHIADVIANVDEIVHGIAGSVEEQSGYRCRGGRQH
jgi:methyl-accepting chemotaxis protein